MKTVVEKFKRFWLFVLKLVKMDRYSRYRRSMEKYFKVAPEKVETFNPPSGKYELRLSYYKTGKGTWNFSRGEVFTAGYGARRKIADVKRNYSHFPFSWVEKHSNGHDYLICGQDYQGQTIIELDTGRRIDYLPERAAMGFGFCWAGAVPSPSKELLAVTGCYWACPYETLVLDFRDPMNLPYPEIARGFSEGGHLSWTDDGKITLYRDTTVRRSDMKRYDDLTDAEQDALPDEEYTDLEESATIGVEDLNDDSWKTLVWKPTGKVV